MASTAHQHNDLNINDNIPGSIYFKWREVLWCPSWDVYVWPNKSQYYNLRLFIKKCDRVRGFLKKPMIVTSGLRPREYNKQIKGARFSQHIKGNAIDFYVKGYEGIKRTSLIRNKLKYKLNEFGIRMEDIDGDWIHIDGAEPGRTGRFFKP